MNYDEFCEWCDNEDIEFTFYDYDNKKMMSFTKDGEWLMNAKYLEDADFEGLTEKIHELLEELEYEEESEI